MVAVERSVNGDETGADYDQSAAFEGGGGVALRAMMDRRIGAAACSVSEGECSAPVHGDSGDYRGIGRIKKNAA